MMFVRIALMAALGVLLGYLAGVFMFAEFDITIWQARDRALVAFLMLIGGAFMAIVGGLNNV